MATIKSCSDLQQSKKLAEILPLESADMSWVSCDNGKEKYFRAENRRIILNYEKKHWIPCWSLAALLGVLPKKYYPIKDHETDLILGKPKDKWCVLYWDATGMQDGEQTLADNPVDACYEMIIKLYELKML